MSKMVVAALISVVDMALLLLLLLLSASADAVSIGSTVYLPESDLGRPLSPRRNTIFEGDISSFLRNQSLHHTYNTRRFQQTSDSLFNELATTFGLSVPIKVLRLSFNTTFRAITSSQVNVSSALILVESYSKRQLILNERRSIQLIPLRPDFLQELRNLPEPPTSITGAGEQWASYRDFLSRWGTHYASEVYYGSWLRTWSTAASSRNYTEREINAKGCADLTGVSSIPTIQGCAGIGVEEMSAASRLDINVQVEVRGGEAGTRAELTVRRIDELIRDFIKEGQESDNAEVKYSFAPIWRPVLERYHSSIAKEWRVATALEGYYNGYLAFPCPYISLPDPLTVLQLFRQTSTGTYQCVRQCQGCRREADCHLHGDGCYCYGRTCIAALGEDGRASIQLSRDELPRNVPPNVNCYYDFLSCRCRLTSNEANCGSDNLIPIWNQAVSVHDADSSSSNTAPALCVE